MKINKYKLNDMRHIDFIPLMLQIRRGIKTPDGK